MHYHSVKDPAFRVVYFGLAWLGGVLLLFLGGLWGASAPLLDPAVPFTDLAELLVAWAYVSAPVWIGTPWVAWNLYQAHLDEVAFVAVPVSRGERQERKAAMEVGAQPLPALHVYARMSIALAVAVALSVPIYLFLPSFEFAGEVFHPQAHAIFLVFLGAFALAVR